MAAPNPVNIARVPGRVILTPTNLSAAYPYGGTELGITRDQAFMPRALYHEEQAEEWGGATSRVLYCGMRARFAAVFRTIDADVQTHIFPENAAGTTSGERVVVPDVNDTTYRAGRALSGSVVLFAPTAINTQNALLLYNAVPMLDDSIRLQLSIKAEMAAAVLWTCMPDANGRTFGWAKLAELSL